MTNWHAIWERRRLDLSESSVLSALMKADGLDTGFGDMTEAAWRTFVMAVSETLGITPSSSIFEVGCGAGAFLYDLAQAGCKVGGSDISASQIQHVRHAIPSGVWSVAEASLTDIEERYDFVIAMGVFMYFPSREYAFEVLRRMALKSVRAIAVLDVPDAAKQNDAMRFRQGTLGDAEYQKRYAGLDHLYLEKAWFEESFARLGFEHCMIQDQAIEGYGNAAFRFNAFGWSRRT